MKDRTDCGEWGIKQEVCERRGCCYEQNQDGAPFCFNPKGNKKLCSLKISVITLKAGRSYCQSKVILVN